MIKCKKYWILWNPQYPAFRQFHMSTVLKPTDTGIGEDVNLVLFSFAGLLHQVFPVIIALLNEM